MRDFKPVSICEPWRGYESILDPLRPFETLWDPLRPSATLWISLRPSDPLLSAETPWDPLTPCYLLRPPETLWEISKTLQELIKPSDIIWQLMRLWLTAPVDPETLWDPLRFSETPSDLLTISKTLQELKNPLISSERLWDSDWQPLWTPDSISFSKSYRICNKPLWVRIEKHSRILSKKCLTALQIILSLCFVLMTWC